MQRCLLFTAFLFAAVSVSGEESDLQSTIEARKAEFRAKAPPEKIAAYADGIEAVVQAKTVEGAIQVGDKAPDFVLPNAQGEKVTLSEQLTNGPVVLTWYRGGWCPYCNIQLAAYQKILPQIEELGGQLIAVSPELPDKSLSTSEKGNLR
ncbi:MAG: peroxiredoxin-like family protein, partial [Verrucomicrobiota bacterium]